MSDAARVLAAVALAFLAGDAAAQDPSAVRTAAAPAMRPVQVSKPMAPNGMIRIWSLAGSLHVVAWDRDSLSVTGEVPEDQPFFCGGNEKALKCAVNVPMKDEDGAAPARLEVRVPRGASVWLKCGSADIAVEGTGGDLDAYSVTGDVRVQGVGRNLAIETMGGHIQIAASATTLRLRTAGGSIALSGRAEDVDASSVAGDIVVRGGGVQRGRFESIDGAVRWIGPLTPGASLELASHGGPVEMHLPKSTRAQFVVSSYRGTFRNDVGGSKLATHDLNGRELTFALGAPTSTRVTLRNFKGPIALVKQ